MERGAFGLAWKHCRRWILPIAWKHCRRWILPIAWKHCRRWILPIAWDDGLVGMMDWWGWQTAWRLRRHSGFPGFAWKHCRRWIPPIAWNDEKGGVANCMAATPPLWIPGLRLETLSAMGRTPIAWDDGCVRPDNNDGERRAGLGYNAVDLTPV